MVEKMSGLINPTTICLNMWGKKKKKKKKKNDGKNKWVKEPYHHLEMYKKNGGKNERDNKPHHHLTEK